MQLWLPMSEVRRIVAIASSRKDHSDPAAPARAVRLLRPLTEDGSAHEAHSGGATQCTCHRAGPYQVESTHSNGVTGVTMSETKKVYIPHAREDAPLVPALKDSFSHEGMDVRSSSINKGKPTDAQDEDRIKQELAAGVDWASTIIILLTPSTNESWWIPWLVKYAAEHGKHIIGLYVQGTDDVNLSEDFRQLGDAAIVGGQGARLVDTVRERLHVWDDPKSGKPRDPEFPVKRYSC